MLNTKTRPLVVAITGGTGSLGNALTKHLLSLPTIGRIRIISRDEFKQSTMAETFTDNRMRFFVGDVRDEDRMIDALSGADVVVHAAAMKQVPACEYNPWEAVKTNIMGTQSVISACIKNGVKKAVFVSTDKAVDPVNHYGTTKKVAENLWLYADYTKTNFAISRWGNILYSRGSVIPIFQEQAKTGTLTITHTDMTRFLLTLEEATKYLWACIEKMNGGETFIPSWLKSARILDIARAIAPEATIKVIGVRKGEKIHETLGDGYHSNDPKRLLTFEEVKALL